MSTATKIDFSALKLTVMDFNAYSHTDPEIFVNRSGITFSRGVLETLNYPSYVQYLIDPKSHVFAVRACKGNETKAKPFSKPRDEQTATVSSSVKAMHDAVARLIPNYSDGKRYKVDGQFFADEKVICFLMTDAEVKVFHKE